MRVQRNGASPVGRFSDGVQFAVLVLLLDPAGSGQWSLTELAREVGWESAVADAVVRLHAAGLVHRVGGFVCASRAAVRFCELLRE
jgi:hypothetical protein